MPRSIPDASSAPNHRDADLLATNSGVLRLSAAILNQSSFERTQSHLTCEYRCIYRFQDELKHSVRGSCVEVMKVPCKTLPFLDDTLRTENIRGKFIIVISSSNKGIMQTRRSDVLPLTSVWCFNTPFLLRLPLPDPAPLQQTTTSY